MTIMKRNGNLFNTMPGFLDDFFNRDLFDWNNSNFSRTDTTLPAVNIKETPENFEVEMAAPGMDKEDFKIELDGNLLTISSEKKQQQEEGDDQKYSRKEFSYQSFHRTFRLSKDVVDAEKIQAKYTNGVLQLLIPKHEQVKQKPARMINVS